MTDSPIIDRRDDDDVLEEARRIASAYTEEWDPDADDVGTALLALFSAMAGNVIERLNQVPEKHRVAFFDALGFGREPPQPARLPVTFRITDDVDENVVIAEGTRMVAPARGERPEQVFELPAGGGFEGTPAAIEAVYTVDPNADDIFRHWDSLGAGTDTRLFTGKDRQKHALLIGHADVLNLKPGSRIWVTVETDARSVRSAVFNDRLKWQFFGEVEMDDGNEEGWQPLDVTLAERSDETMTLRLEFPSNTTKTKEKKIGEVRSRWIRCRIPTDEELRDESKAYSPQDLFDVTVRSVSLSLVAPNGDASTEILPDDLLSGDVPLEAKPREEAAVDLYPFGEAWPLRNVFYVASEEAFTKKDATVNLKFEPSAGTEPGADEGSSTDGNQPMPVDGRDPRLSWEYWNGEGWAHLPDLDDDTSQLRRPKTVSFTVPGDLEPTTAAGHRGHWIRARVVSGEYVRVTYDEDDVKEGKVSMSTAGVLPRFRGVRIFYEAENGPVFQPSSVLTHNNLEYRENLAKELTTEFSSAERPFFGLPDAKQTLYVGFDGELRDGPINLLFSLADKEYPEGFYPRIRWEYCTDPEGDEWVRLQVQDGTESLTKQGIVRFNLSGETAATELFGHDLHWIRATVTGQEFSRIQANVGGEKVDAAARTTERRGGMTSSGVVGPREVSGRETTLLSGTPDRTPPVLRGVHPNTGWAYNVQTIDEELLGSSDGSPAQLFTFDVPPVIDEAVWIDEFRTISKDTRQKLMDVQPDEVEPVTGPDGELREFWIQWERVEDFMGSARDDRHYTLDPTSGELAFGNGVRGKIPPRGRDNVRTRYRTGGGFQGNVAAGAVTDLVSSIPFVDAVTNPVSGDGGADAEPIEGVFTRAPRQLRHRGRAVTAADVERIALDASRKLARVRCIPEMDRSGDHHIGWVTLLIVPNVQQSSPSPSPELKERVFEAVRERSSTTLVGSERPRLIVRGPRYVEVSATARLVPESVGSISTLEERVEAEITAFLHPLTGGPNGEGWGFGEGPYLSDLYALLEGIEEVDHVRDLSVTFTRKIGTTSVTEGDPTSILAQDELIYSGMHEVRVIRAEASDSMGER